MSYTRTFKIKPAPQTDPGRLYEGGPKFLLVPFPPGPYGRRYLDAEGEVVEATTGLERLWWISLLRTGDVVECDAPAARENYTGPPVREPDDPGENVPDLKPVRTRKRK